MTSVRALVAALLCCLALAASAPVSAADAAQGRTAFDEGQRLVLAGDYRAALAAFEKGYLATDDAAFLLNMAQCHRLLGENKEAVMMFKLYLKSTPETGNREARSVATKAIRELESAPAAAPTPPPTAAAQPRPAPSRQRRAACPCSSLRPSSIRNRPRPPRPRVPT
jgi:tetratricopeptide (TPR) repeat protein